jgi:hypothetical protein
MDGWSLEYNIDVDKERRLVLVKIFGAWRERHAHEYHEDFEKEAGILFKKPWARLVDLSSWKTSFPGVVEAIAEHMRWCHEHNNVLTIYVLNHPSTFRQLNEMIEKGGIKQEAQVFRTMKEAEDYLAANWPPKKK